MSKYVEIEAKLKTIEGGLFQRLCNELLLRMGYQNIHSLGSQAGTDKTTPGTPDTYFKDDEGKYIFVEYTTQQDNIFKKIKDDIIKCFNSKKTGIPVQDIVEIIYCHVSSNLTPQNDKELHDLCSEKNVKLNIYGIDDIADKINRYYKSLAKDYLGISIDTNQIFTIDEYIKWYDSNEMMSPLSTTFQFRNEEMTKMIASLENNKVILVKGKAGVGKTRLSLEVVKQFSKDNDYKVYCIKSFDLQIREDIASVIDRPGNYLLLIDDANELIGLKFILNYLNPIEEGYNIKIVATVRDYTANTVYNQIREYTEPCVFILNSFTDEQIKEFLSMNFEIKNEVMLNKIFKICEGNARIAYMAGKLIKEKESLSAINDSTELYKAYYSKYINNSFFATDFQLLRVAGVLSTANTINLANMDYLQSTLKLINITQEEFRDSLLRLCELEYAEIKMDYVATIPDQCLRNYILYYCFCEKKIISLANFVEIGFKNFTNKTNNLIGILWNIFGSDHNKNYINEELNKVWEKYEQIGGNLFLSFMKSYGTIRPEETLIKIKEIIEESELKTVDICKIDFSSNSYRISNDVLELVEQFSLTNYIQQAIELLCEYAEKRQDLIKDIYERIRDDFSFNLDSYRYNYLIQNEVMDTISLKRLSNVITKLYLGLAKYFLKFEHETHESNRGEKFTLYRILLQYNSGSVHLRKNIWNELIKIVDDIVWKDEILDILNSYSRCIDDNSNVELLKKEKHFVVELVNKFESNNLPVLILCSRLKRKWLKYGIEYNDEFEFLFKSDLWTTYRLFGQDDFGGSDYKTKEEKRKKEIALFAKSFSFEKLHQLITYLNIFSKMDDSTSNIVGKHFESFINEFRMDYSKLKTILCECIEAGQEINFHPRELIRLLIITIGASETYLLLTNTSYPQQNYWQYNFFDMLPLDNINEFWADECIQFLNNNNDMLIKQSALRELHFLEKFETIRPNIFFDGCEIICNKYHYSPFIVSIYFELLFNEYRNKPNELYTKFKNNKPLLRKIYFLLVDYSEHTDYNGKFLNYFITQDKLWLEEYVAYLYTSIENNEHGFERLSYFWEQDNYIEIYDYVFDNFSKPKDDYFFRTESGLKHLFIHKKGYDKMAKRQDEWIIHAVNRYAFDEKIYPLFSIISNLGINLRKEALIKFIEVNSDYSIFEKLQIVSIPNIIYNSEKPYLENEIKFCEALLEDLTSITYLRHKALIKNIKSSLRKSIKDEEVRELLRESNY